MRRDESGSGLVDVIVGFLVFAILIALSATLMQNIGTQGADVQANQQAITTAESVLAQERALGCGAVTGYGTASAAAAVWSDCTFGRGGQHVTGYGDWSGAVYTTGAFTETVKSSSSWGWSEGAPSCSGLTTGTQVATPPNVLTRTVVAAWRDHHISGNHTRTLTYTSSTPPILAQGWDVGGLGAIAVQASAGTVVSLSVPGWSNPITTAVQPGGCAWLPYVPAGSGYVVDVNGTPTTVSVGPGQWTVVG